jgi:hypothetical protein
MVIVWGWLRTPAFEFPSLSPVAPNGRAFFCARNPAGGDASRVSSAWDYWLIATTAGFWLSPSIQPAIRIGVFLERLAGALFHGGHGLMSLGFSLKGAAHALHGCAGWLCIIVHLWLAGSNAT